VLRIKMETIILATIACGIIAKYVESKLESNLQEQKKERTLELLKTQYHCQPNNEISYDNKQRVRIWT